MLADLIEAIAPAVQSEEGESFRVLQAGGPSEPICPGDGRFHHSYASWAQFRADCGTAWRVEEYLGLDRGAGDGSPEGAEWQKVSGDTSDADIVVLDDAGLGFRDRPQLWPQALDAGGRQVKSRSSCKIVSIGTQRCT